MAYKLIALLLVAIGFLLFSSGAFCCEGTARAAIGGRLMVRARGRAVIMAAHCYRPNRTYYQVVVHHV